MVRGWKSTAVFLTLNKGYLFLLIACKDQIKQGHSWGIFQLQDKFRLKVMTKQIRHSMNLEVKKLQRAS